MAELRNGATEQVQLPRAPITVISVPGPTVTAVSVPTYGTGGSGDTYVHTQTEEATVWEAVLAAVAALDPQPRLVAETQLASAPGFRRDSLLIAQLGPVLGLTEEMIDNLFIAAKALP